MLLASELVADQHVYAYRANGSQWAPKQVRMVRDSIRCWGALRTLSKRDLQLPGINLTLRLMYTDLNCMRHEVQKSESESEMRTRKLKDYA